MIASSIWEATRKETRQTVRCPSPCSAPMEVRPLQIFHRSSASPKAPRTLDMCMSRRVSTAEGNEGCQHSRGNAPSHITLPIMCKPGQHDPPNSVPLPPAALGGSLLRVAMWYAVWWHAVVSAECLSGGVSQNARGVAPGRGHAKESDAASPSGPCSHGCRSGHGQATCRRRAASPEPSR